MLFTSSLCSRSVCHGSFVRSNICNADTLLRGYVCTVSKSVAITARHRSKIKWAVKLTSVMQPSFSTTFRPHSMQCIAETRPIATDKVDRSASVLVTTESPAKSAEPIEMPLGAEDSLGHKEPSVRQECTWAPPGECDGFIGEAAVLRFVATIPVATHFKFRQNSPSL